MNMWTCIHFSRVRRVPDVPLWAVMFVIGWSVIIACYEVFKPADLGSLCIVKGATGVPCPTCGSTRAVKSILTGDLLQATLSNPFIVIAGAVIGLWCLTRIVFGCSLRIETGSRGHRAIWLLLLTLFIFNWSYLVWAGI